jgi:hypothetical protein
MNERHGGCVPTLVVKPEGNRHITRLLIRGQANIKLDLKENECEGVGWIFLARYRDHWRPFFLSSYETQDFTKSVNFLTTFLMEALFHRVIWTQSVLPQFVILATF